VKRACGTRRLVRASLHGATRRFVRAQRVLHIANGDASLNMHVIFLYYELLTLILHRQASIASTDGRRFERVIKGGRCPMLMN
jgi:hypothetical protein